MKRILAGLISLMLFVGVVAKVYASAEIFEVITLSGTTTARLSTSLTTDEQTWNKYAYMEAFIKVQSGQGMRYQILGTTGYGTPTSTSGVFVADKEVIKLHTLKDMQNIVFACGTSTTPAGTLTVFHSRSQLDPKGIEIVK